MKKSFEIVKKISVIDSIDTMAEGEKITLNVAEFAPYNSIVAAILRLNKKYGYEAFTYASSANGTVFDIERHKAS